MKEIVLYLFIQKNKVLLEYRKGPSGKYEDLGIPSGSVTEKDNIRSHRYIEHALHREIYDRYGGTVIPLQYEEVNTIKDKESDSLLHVFFLYSWDGEHPTYSVKNGEHNTRLRWLTIADAIEAVKSETGARVLKWAKETIRIRSILHRRVYH